MVDRKADWKVPMSAEQWVDPMVDLSVIHSVAYLAVTWAALRAVPLVGL